MKYQISLIRRVGAKLFHAEGRKEMTKLTVGFRHFLNTPKSYLQALFLLLPSISN